MSKTQISKELGVDRSTIYRELDRNSNRNSKAYDPKLAHQKYKKRMREKPKHIRFTDEMKQLARDKLALQWSPEQIVGWCRRLGIPMVSHDIQRQGQGLPSARQSPPSRQKEAETGQQ